MTTVTHYQDVIAKRKGVCRVCNKAYSKGDVVMEVELFPIGRRGRQGLFFATFKICSSHDPYELIDEAGFLIKKKRGAWRDE